MRLNRPPVRPIPLPAGGLFLSAAGNEPRRAGLLRISRRAALGGLAAAAVAPWVLAGCSTLGQRGETLTVGLAADPAGLNPLLQTGLAEASVWSNVYDPLVWLDADARQQPGLAESWRVVDDRTVEFRLRGDVRFQDGAPFDSAAVRATIEAMLAPESASPVRAQLGAIERVEEVEPLVVRIVTRQPFAPLLAELTQLPIVSPRQLQAVGMNGLAERPVGTGPYRLVEWVRDDRIVLEANADHWRGAPAIRRVVLRPIPDDSTRLAAVRAGDVDLAINIPSDHVDLVRRAGLNVVSRPGVQTLYLRFNARRPPLDDVRVRRALVHAVDADSLIENLYGGRARRVNAPYPPEVFGSDDAPPPAYDPARARALLVEAGHGDGLQLTLEAPRGRYPRDDQLPTAVAGQLAAVGVQVETRAMEWGAYLQRVQAGQGADMFLLAGTNRTFDPHFTMTRLYSTTSSFGRDYYGNAAIDAPIAEAAATLDPARRQALYQQVLATLRDDAPAIWLAQLDDVYAVRPRVQWAPRADSLLWLGAARIVG